MNIPNDSGAPWRLNKFVEYQHYALPISYTVVPTFGRIAKLSEEELVLLAVYTGMTYEEATGIVMLRKLPYKTIRKSDVTSFWEKEKPNLIFNSSRRYTKNMDWFVPLMDSYMSRFKREPLRWLLNLTEGKFPRAAFKAIEDELLQIRYNGIFAATRTLELLEAFSAQGMIPPLLRAADFNWKDGSNMTSGLLNVFYFDEEADMYDKHKTLPARFTKEVLESMLGEVIDAVQRTYPDQIITKVSVSGKLCSWRNLFKANRYGGYHYDRQLETLRHYEQVYPELQNDWEDLFYARKESLHHHLLGELNGWNGIRKERKKLWLREGCTGAEITC